MTEAEKVQRRNELLALSSRMRIKASNVIQAAAHNGQWTDGGGGALEAQCDAFEAGLSLTCPKDWKKEYEEMMKAEDPDYQEYKRLKKKFGDA